MNEWKPSPEKPEAIVLDDEELLKVAGGADQGGTEVKLIVTAKDFEHKLTLPAKRYQ